MRRILLASEVAGTKSVLLWSREVRFSGMKISHYHQLALQPGVGLGLRYNMPSGLSVPCSVSPFVYTHLSQVHGHVIQPSHSWSSSSSCCIQLSVQHLFWDCCVLHSFFMPKPSYSLAFNKPDNVVWRYLVLQKISEVLMDCTVDGEMRSNVWLESESIESP